MNSRVRCASSRERRAASSAAPATSLRRPRLPVKRSEMPLLSKSPTLYEMTLQSCDDPQWKFLPAAPESVGLGTAPATIRSPCANFTFASATRRSKPRWRKISSASFSVSIAGNRGEASGGAWARTCPATQTTVNATMAAATERRERMLGTSHQQEPRHLRARRRERRSAAKNERKFQGEPQDPSSSQRGFSRWRKRRERSSDEAGGSDPTVPAAPPGGASRRGAA